MLDRERIKVLYISGWGRSGRTILSNILGQIDGFFPVGEIRFIWERNLLENRLCGCGAPFVDCTIWQDIFEKAYGGFEQIDAKRMGRLCESLTRTRHIPRMLLGPEKMKSNPEAAEYLDNLERLYCAIQSVTGSRVIVDSSKYPSYAAILDLLPLLDLYIVHLVRDSRAVSFSWGKKKRQPDTVQDEFMIQFSPFQSSMIWNSWNVLTELFWRKTSGKYMLLRYEDFIMNPQESMRRLLRLVHEDIDSHLFEDENKVHISPNHTLSGNPVRFQNGVLSLKVDDEWRKKPKRAEFLLTTLLTWPLLLKYQYFR